MTNDAIMAEYRTILRNLDDALDALSKAVGRDDGRQSPWLNEAIAEVKDRTELVVGRVLSKKMR